MLSITVDGLQVDNQLPSALFPALLRPRPLPPAKRLPDGSKAPVGVIQLDGLAPRPADRPPALHFFAKRRAADAYTSGAGAAGAAAAKRASFTDGQRERVAKTPRAKGDESVVGEASSGGGGSDDGGGGAGEEQQQQSEELDMVVYYYDVATFWIRPVDLKVIENILERIFSFLFFSFVYVLKLRTVIVLLSFTSIACRSGRCAFRRLHQFLGCCLFRRRGL